eukprot:04174.XXX_198970_198390_1 [CDS] Oithona nana genome sequencing.
MAERPEDLNLPSSVVSRIIKEALPPSVKVSKEAQAAVAKAASVFVLYATSCANNVALKSHRKTIHGNDVIKAMDDMEFEKFIKPLENSLDCWKESQQKKKDSAKKKRDAKKEEEEQKNGDDEDNDEDDDDVIEVDPNGDQPSADAKEANGEHANDDEDDDDDIDEVQEVSP